MELKGTIEAVFQEQQVTDAFKKREFVVRTEENPEYPESVKLEMIQGQCDTLNDVCEGMTVTAQINLKGRKWTNPQGEDKYFNTIQCWKLEVDS